jgi:hypothetical protein
MENLNEESMVCAYIIGGNLTYVGELYYSEEDKEQNKVIFRKVLVRVADQQTKTTKWIILPTVGKESSIVIDTRTMPGVLVKNIDSDEAQDYRDALLKLHSKLHLA